MAETYSNQLRKKTPYWEKDKVVLAIGAGLIFAYMIYRLFDGTYY